MLSKPYMALSALIGTNVLWASVYTVSKALMDAGQAAPSPLAMSFWRLLLATLVLFPLAWRQRPRRPFTTGEWTAFVNMGVVGIAMACLTQFIGTKLSLATNASLITALETVATVLLAALFLGETLYPRTIVSLVLATAGVVLLSDLHWQQLDLASGQYALGNGLLVVSILCYSAYTIVGKGVIRSLPPLVVTGYPFAVATLAIGLACAWFEPEALAVALTWSWPTWAGIAYIGIAGTALTYLIWNAVLVTGNVGTMSLTLYIQPVFGALIAWACLGERLSGKALIGAAAVIAAVLLAAIRPRQAGEAIEVNHGTASLPERR